MEEGNGCGEGYELDSGECFGVWSWADVRRSEHQLGYLEHSHTPNQGFPPAIR